MGLIVFVSIFTTIGLLRYFGDRDKKHRALTAACPPPPIDSTDIVFSGSEAGISFQEIDRILRKRCSYYVHLEEKLQHRFLQRVLSFMNKKVFIIKDDEGFKEMPVLVSAAAVQLSFGLKHYRLPFYQYIRIYPEEFIAENSFAVLAGRVQNNVITIAWNHFLQGNTDPFDGSNVGLHEMSHALYIQKMVIEENYAKQFSKKYHVLLSECKEAFAVEAEGKKDLYSAYANSNLQEFWAESVELFFEKPQALSMHYPDVYNALKLLLNQNPLNQSSPVLNNKPSFDKKFRRITRSFLRRRFGKQPSQAL